jgi:hypothetical protein
MTAVDDVQGFAHDGLEIADGTYPIKQKLELLKTVLERIYAITNHVLPG